MARRSTSSFTLVQVDSEGGAHTAYERLGVGPGCSNERVSQRLKELARIHHPDKGGSVGDMVALLEAARLLQGNRAAYDSLLRISKRLPVGCGVCSGNGVLQVRRGLRGPLVWGPCTACKGTGIKVKK